jgi:hypothetical protein
MTRDPDAYEPEKSSFRPEDGNLRDRYLESLDDASISNSEPDPGLGMGTKLIIWLGIALLILGSFYLYRFAAPDAYVHWYQKKNGDWVAAADSSVTLRIIEPTRLTGSVLSKQSYRDEFSKISPMDYVLGWEMYLDPTKAASLAIWQGDRTYYWTNPHVGAMRQVTSATANLHLIAADNLIAASLQKLEKGQFVKIEGQLVDVYHNGQKIWESSRSPTDIGYNSGEIIFVERVQTIR